MNPTTPAKLNALTGLRYIAALTILLSHMSGNYPAGSLQKYTASLSGIGMPLFFVLSGFLMVYNYSAQFQSVFRKTLWSFYVARFARIYPLYIISLLLWFSFVGGFFHDLHDHPNDTYKTLFYVGTLTQSWVDIPTFVGADSQKSVTLTFMAVAWSVSTEAFFYLVFPILILPIAWLVKRGLHAIIAGLAVYLAMMALDASLIPWYETAVRNPNYEYGSFRWVTYLCPYLRLGEFVIGAIAGQYFLCRSKDSSQVPNRNWWLGTLGLTICIVALFRVNHWIYTPHNPSVWLQIAAKNILLAPLCAGLVYYLATLPCLLQRTLGSKVMVELGNASFAIYLLHPLMQSLYFPRTAGETDLKNTYIIVYNTLAMCVCLHFLCLGLYRYAEVPLRDGIRRLLDPKKANIASIETATHPAMTMNKRAA